MTSDRKFQISQRTTRISIWTSLVAAGTVLIWMGKSPDQQWLMPGPLTSSHSAISDCTACHTSQTNSRFTWMHTMFARPDPVADSKGCIVCHKIQDHSFAPHNASQTVLQQKTRTFESRKPANNDSAEVKISKLLFETKDKFAEGIYCATCHREHKGMDFKSTRLSDQQCQGCHVKIFDSFKSDHPEFLNYPFKRRTRISFDHAAHIQKHFPETRKKKQIASSAVPEQCSFCHTPDTDPRIMAIKPFSQTCSTCHLDGILGKGRVTGAQGIGLFTVPGLDVETLKEKGIDIGSWPEDSEAELTPLTKFLLSLETSNIATLKSIESLDLLDLTEANSEQLAAVQKLAWAIKSLLNDLISKQQSWVVEQLAEVSSAGKQRNSDLKLLLASLPRDVLIGAQNSWLPNLSAEIESRPKSEPKPNVETASREAKEWDSAVVKAEPEEPEAQKSDEPEAQKTDEEEPQVASASSGNKSWRIDAYGNLLKGGEAKAVNEGDEDEENEESDESDSDTAPEQEEGGEQETALAKEWNDSELWSELGGWYRKDYTIHYKPNKHEDSFYRAWLDYSKINTRAKANPYVREIFELLSNKDAQGQCTKCHTVDANANQNYKINWKPKNLSGSNRPLTKFLHEPHLSLVGNDGCMTCHKLNKETAKKKTDRFDPSQFQSNFSKIESNTCAECHNDQNTRQDCLVCHNYHSETIQSKKPTTLLTLQEAPKEQQSSQR